MSTLSGCPIMKQVHEIAQARKRIAHWRAEHGYTDTHDQDHEEAESA